MNIPGWAKCNIGGHPDGKRRIITAKLFLYPMKSEGDEVNDGDILINISNQQVEQAEQREKRIKSSFWEQISGPNTLTN